MFGSPHPAFGGLTVCPGDRLAATLNWMTAVPSTFHTTTASPGRFRAAVGSPSLVLFLAFLASQSGVLVLSPILSDVAADFGVSVAVAGQLRILAAPLAVVADLAAGRLLPRF